MNAALAITNAALAITLAVLFGFGVLGGLALWLGARLGAHVEAQAYRKDGRQLPFAERRRPDRSRAF